MEAPVVLAIGCHPDDIEFMMAGTLLRLRGAGAVLHYCNLANGNAGSNAIPARAIAATRLAEARRAAGLLGAEHHPPLVDDLMVFYEDGLIRRVLALVRGVKPRILLLPSPDDYMEDHMNTARVGVTAAFCRGMRNYRSRPDVPPYGDDVAVYHALPYGLKDMMDRRVAPDFTVDIAGVLPRKTEMLACHASQKVWLDETQGVDAYLKAMKDMAAEVGRASGTFTHAEGWRRHNPLGFCAPGFAPLEELLGPSLVKRPA
jgi:N-acetylglucosamine malate deacetylase 1